MASRLAVDFIRQQPRVIFAGEDAIPHAAQVGPAVLVAEERALHAGLREQILLCGNQLLSEAPAAGSTSVSLNQPVVFFMGADPHQGEIFTFLHSERWRDAPSEFPESAVLFGLAGFVEEKSESPSLGIIFNLMIPLLPILAWCTSG